MESASEWVHMDFIVIMRETERAFLIRFTMTDPAQWIPKSQVADVDDYAAGDRNGTISVTEWIAREKGFVQ